MTLKDRLIQRIEATGPMPLEDFIAAAMLDPQSGYYATRDPLGSAGDFVTAPEISQMFGELIGACLAQTWLAQGAPDPVTLAELGPGRGTLLADALRATRGVPGFHAALDLVLFEASAVLRDRQAATLEGYAPRWIDRIEDLPQAPLLLIANEFFDALPIRQFERGGTGWRARHVGAEDGRLVMGLGPRRPIPALAHRLEDTRDGDVVEDRPAAAPIVAALTARIADHGGAALVIDYGDWRSLGDTLQALRGHQIADPLADPGGADVTAHVDFEALARAAECRHTRLTPQGVFLERLGITQRAQALADRLGGDALGSHVAAHRRLTHPAEMGNLFKVLGFYPGNATPPPGLDA